MNWMSCHNLLAYLPGSRIPVSQAHQAAIVKAVVRVEILVGPLSHRLTGASIQGFSPNRLLRPAL